MGRPVIFRDKEGGERVQGNLTKKGAEYFRGARLQLANMAGVEYSKVTHADVIEFLARGVKNTRLYLDGKAK